tara:strand:- start:85 stop:318 length:234 start_codon:yes stop_codon:yes gene_type:complete
MDAIKIKQIILKGWDLFKTTDIVPFVILAAIVAYASQQHNDLQERVHKIEKVINEGIYIPDQPTPPITFEPEESCNL